MLEHEQVAAVGVDVHQVRVERADTQDTARGRGRRKWGSAADSGTQHHHGAADVLIGRRNH